MSNEHRRNLPVPFFSQREVTYYWQRIEKGGDKKVGDPVSLAYGSCNITSLCMILNYFGITDDSPDDMLKKFYEKFRPEWLQEAYPVSGEYTGPDRLMVGANLQSFAEEIYSIHSSYINIGELNVTGIERKIAAGYPVLISYGALIGGGELVDGKIVGGNGHIAVVRGFTEQDDAIINDPWGDMSTPYGFLLPKTGDVRQFYSKKINGNDAYYGLGNGDNCILRRGEFISLTRYPKKEELNWTLVIEYPHIWSFPFRETVLNIGNSEEKIIRFSEHRKKEEKTEKTKEEKDAFREGQIKKMLGMESVKNAGYPISSNLQWHDGIHIRRAGKPVYAVGPGRLVAARVRRDNKTPQSGSSNFVLVRHQVTIGKEKKEFYSHHMHLADVDIKARIEEQLIPGEEREPREKDWIDQLIERIHPKRALILAGDGMSGLEGTNAPMTYRLEGGELKEANERLQDRAVIYLRSKYDYIQDAVEYIDCESEFTKNMRDFYTAVNDVEKYKWTLPLERKDTECYSYYYRKRGAGNTVEWEFRYVPVDNGKIIPQNVNMPEVIYYRRMLAKLLRGETAVFSQEDIDAVKDMSKYAKGKNALDLFKETIKLVFSSVFKEAGVDKISIKFENLNTFRDAIRVLYDAIKVYYKDQINDLKKQSVPAFVIDKQIDSFTKKCSELGRILLTYPADMLTKTSDIFTINGDWYKKLISLYREILLYENPASTPLTVKDQSETINREVKLLEEKICGYMPSNVDYHIEVNGNTKLGMPGNFDGENGIIHFEIFSDAQLIDDKSGTWTPESPNFVYVDKANNKNEYFNVGKIIEALIEKDFFKGSDCFKYLNIKMISMQELDRSYRQGILKPFQYAVVEHLHSHAEMPESEWKEYIKKGSGINKGLFDDSKFFKEWLAYKWFSKEAVKELEPLSSEHLKELQAFFYHPVRFLEWLDKNKIT